METETERIRFELKKLTVIHEHFNKESITKGYEKNSSHHLRVEIVVVPKDDIVIIKVGFSIKVDESSVALASLDIENEFHVHGLKKLTATNEDNEIILDNHRFASYLIDNSIAHLRGIQSHKMQGIFDSIPFVPFVNSSTPYAQQKKVAKPDPG